MADDRAILNSTGQLGLLQEWGWKKSHIFMNAETGVTIEARPEDVTMIDKAVWDDVWKERNRPVEYFDPANSLYNGKPGLSERQIHYGVIHDTTLESCFFGGTNRFWTADFCRGLAQMVAMLEMSESLMAGGVSKLNDLSKEEKDVFIKRFLIGDNSVYEVWCNRSGLHNGKTCDITEEEIVEAIKRVKALPTGYRENILGATTAQGEEMDYYKNLA